MTYGQRIKQRRKELKLSVDELAQKIDKSRATIYRYENGDIEDMPISIVEPLANALETTPAYLMGWESADYNYVVYNNDIPIHVERTSTKQSSLSNHILMYAAKLAKLPVERQDIIFKMIDELSSNEKAATRNELADSFPSEEEMFSSDSDTNRKCGS